MTEIIKLEYLLLSDIEELIAVSVQEGYGMAKRLAEEYENGINISQKTGEAPYSVTK